MQHMIDYLRLFCNMRLITTLRAVKTSMRVERALIMGRLGLRFIMPYISTGRVPEPGPATKNVMTKSSMDKVKASRPPAMIPGRISGNWTRQKVVQVLARDPWQLR